MADPDNALAAAARKTFTSSFGAVLQLASDEGDAIFVDGRATPPVVAEKAPAGVDCVWRAPGDVLLRAISSERALEQAYISGQLAVSGDMSVMSRMQLGKPK